MLPFRREKKALAVRMTSRDTLRKQAVFDAVRALRRVAEQQQAVVFGEYEAQTTCLRKAIQIYAARLPEPSGVHWEAVIDRSPRAALSPSNDAGILVLSSPMRPYSPHSTEGKHTWVNAASGTSHPVGTAEHCPALALHDVPDLSSQSSLLGRCSNSASSVYGPEREDRRKYRQAPRAWDPRHSLLGLVQPPPASRKSLMLGARARRRRRLTALYERKMRPCEAPSSQETSRTCPNAVATSQAEERSTSSQTPADIFAFDGDEDGKEAKAMTESITQGSAHASALASEKVSRLGPGTARSTRACTNVSSKTHPPGRRQPVCRGTSAKTSNTTTRHRSHCISTQHASAKASPTSTTARETPDQRVDIRAPKTPQGPLSSGQRTPVAVLNVSTLQTKDEASPIAIERPRLSRLSTGRSFVKDKAPAPSIRASGTRKRRQRKEPPPLTPPGHEASLLSPKPKRTNRERLNNTAARARLLASELLSPFSRAKAEQRTPRKDETYCRRCKGMDDPHLMLLCDGCDDCFHTYCCRPPLDRVPDEDWYCEQCAHAPCDQVASNTKPNTSRITPTLNTMPSANSPTSARQDFRSKRNKSSRRQYQTLGQLNISNVPSGEPGSHTLGEPAPAHGRASQTRAAYHRIGHAPSVAAAGTRSSRSESETAELVQSSVDALAESAPSAPSQEATTWKGKRRVQKAASSTADAVVSRRPARRRQWPSGAFAVPAVTSEANAPMERGLLDEQCPASAQTEFKTAPREAQVAAAATNSSMLGIHTKSAQSPESLQQPSANSIRSEIMEHAIATPQITPPVQSGRHRSAMDQNRARSEESPSVTKTPRQPVADGASLTSCSQAARVHSTLLASPSNTCTKYAATTSSSPHSHHEHSDQTRISLGSSDANVSKGKVVLETLHASQLEDETSPHPAIRGDTSLMKPTAMFVTMTGSCSTSNERPVRPETLPSPSKPGGALHVSSNDTGKLSTGDRSAGAVAPPTPQTLVEQLTLAHASENANASLLDCGIEVTACTDMPASVPFPVTLHGERVVLETAEPSPGLESPQSSMALAHSGINAKPCPIRTTMLCSAAPVPVQESVQQCQEDACPLQTRLEYTEPSIEPSTQAAGQSPSRLVSPDDRSTRSSAIPRTTSEASEHTIIIEGVSGVAPTSARVDAMHPLDGPSTVEDVGRFESLSAAYAPSESLDLNRPSSCSPGSNHKPRSDSDHPSKSDVPTPTAQQLPWRAADAALSYTDAAVTAICVAVSCAPSEATSPNHKCLPTASGFASEISVPATAAITDDRDDASLEDANDQHVTSAASVALSIADQRPTWLDPNSARKSLELTPRPATLHTAPSGQLLADDPEASAANIETSQQLGMMATSKENFLQQPPNEAPAVPRQDAHPTTNTCREQIAASFAHEDEALSPYRVPAQVSLPERQPNVSSTPQIAIASASHGLQSAALLDCPENTNIPETLPMASVPSIRRVACELSIHSRAAEAYALGQEQPGAADTRPAGDGTIHPSHHMPDGAGCVAAQGVASNASITSSPLPRISTGQISDSPPNHGESIGSLPSERSLSNSERMLRESKETNSALNDTHQTTGQESTHHVQRIQDAADIPTQAIIGAGESPSTAIQVPQPSTNQHQSSASTPIQFRSATTTTNRSSADDLPTSKDLKRSDHPARLASIAPMEQERIPSVSEGSVSAQAVPISATTVPSSLIASQYAASSSSRDLPAPRIDTKEAMDVWKQPNNGRSPHRPDCHPSGPSTFPTIQSHASDNGPGQGTATVAGNKLSRTEVLRTRIEKLRALRVGTYQGQVPVFGATPAPSTEQVPSCTTNQSQESVRNDLSEMLATPGPSKAQRRDPSNSQTANTVGRDPFTASHTPSRLLKQSPATSARLHPGHRTVSRPSPNKAWKGGSGASIGYSRHHQVPPTLSEENASMGLPLISHQQPARSPAMGSAVESIEPAQKYQPSGCDPMVGMLQYPDASISKSEQQTMPGRSQSPTKPLVDRNTDLLLGTPFATAESALDAQQQQRREEKRRRILEHQRRLALEAERQQARLEPLRHQAQAATPQQTNEATLGAPDIIPPAKVLTETAAGYPLTPERRAPEDVSDDDSAAVPAAKRHLVPEWARSHRLYGALIEQTRVDPDTIFHRVHTCDLVEIFRATNRPRYRRRTSSGDWVLDRLTWREEAAYRRALGFDP